MKTMLRVISLLMLLTGMVSLAVGGINIGVIYEGFSAIAIGNGIAALLSAAVIILLILGGITDLICGLLGLQAAGRDSRRDLPCDGLFHPAPARPAHPRVVPDLLHHDEIWRQGCRIIEEEKQA